SVFLLTCWQVLLWKLTAESNIIVGAAFDGRYYEELQDALGLFVKYLPLHCRLNSDDLFEVALRSAQRAWQEAALWQDYFAPEHLGYVFPQSSGPVFYVPLAFDFQVAPAPLRLAGLQFSLLSQRICLDRFQLKLSCWRHSDGLQAEFHFNAKSFEASDVVRMGSQYEQLLRGALQLPEAKVCSLSVLNEVERRQILYGWNSTEGKYPARACLHELIEAQVERTPDSTAVVRGGERLSYRELNR